MFENFLKKLAHDVYYGIGDTDHPKCPQCGSRMDFTGGDLEFGEGHWDCKECGYSVTEDDLD